MKPSEASHQLPLRFSGEPAPRLVKTTRPANKARSKAASTQPSLPVVSKRRYLPVAGVPKTRADCPDTSEQHCPYVRCRWHLHRLDASDRAGRPGLSSVPRDARGWTLPVDGDVGEERAGTTVVPRWLELERYCSVWLERSDDGQIVAVNAVREGEWDQFVGALHPGERIEAQNDNAVVVANADVRGVGEDVSVVLDRDPGEFMLRLVRVRGVPSCALDVIERKGKMNNEQVGDAIGRHRTLVAREVREAIRKGLETAEEMGIEQDDFVGALMRMGGMG